MRTLCVRAFNKWHSSLCCTHSESIRTSVIIVLSSHNLRLQKAHNLMMSLCEFESA